MEDEDIKEIELIDLLNVVWKWKWLIVLITLACAVAAGLISFLMKPIYDVSMVIEPGVYDVDSNGKFIYLDSPANVKSKIESGAYESKIIKKLGVDPKKYKFKFKVVVPKKSNTLIIRIESKDINMHVQACSFLFSELLKEYHHYVDSRKAELDRTINMNNQRLDIGVTEKKYLENEIIQVRNNTKKTIEERNMLIKKSGNSSGKLSLLIYTNIIQQDMKYYNELNDQLNRLMKNNEKIKKEIEVLQIKSKSVENIRLIQPAQSSACPIKPKKKLNVILAFVVGFFISIFLAFFLEYIKKMKDYPKSSINLSQTSSIENQEK